MTQKQNIHSLDYLQYSFAFHLIPSFLQKKTGKTNSCNSNSDICSLSKGEWAWDSGKTHTSIISEWDLECVNSFITGLPTTCYFVGSLLGGLALASLADSSLGRKNLLIFSSLFMSLFALASGFSPNIWVYSGFRFLSGIGRAPIAVSILVLLTERVGKRWRGHVTMIGFFQISLGILALTGISYVTRASSWRTLYLCTSIPGIVCSIFSYFFLCESPRWLFTQGREKEAIVVLRKIGSTTQIFPNLVPNMFPQQKKILPSNNNPFSSLKILINTRWVVNQLMVSVMLGFGIGFLFFGMFLGAGNLGFNVYLSSVFNALLSLISYLLTFLFWVQRFNRRSSLLGFCMISGTTSIIFSVLGKGHKGLLIGLELVSLFCASMAYNVVMVYMVELFPTCIRNSATSLVRQAMILGSVFDPILILIGKRNMIYSYGIFGLTMLLCGFLVVFLPETKDKVLCDTMEEQECRDNNSGPIV